MTTRDVQMQRYAQEDLDCVPDIQQADANGDVPDTLALLNPHTALLARQLAEARRRLDEALAAFGTVEHVLAGTITGAASEQE